MTNATDLERALVEARARLRTLGWTDADFAGFERRRVPEPFRGQPDGRVRFLLLMYGALPRLPEVSIPDEALAARGIDPGMLVKIRALLAKAESTTFPEEAEALSAKAQELMTRYRIDAVVVGGRAGSGGPGGTRIWIDDPYADAKVSLLGAVARANGCESVQLGGLGCVHVVGFPADLEVVELLHTSLLVQAATAMLAAGPQVDARGRSRTRSFRQSFLLAYAWRVGGRLAEANAATEQAVDAEHGGGLLPVLRDRDREVEAAVAELFPKAGTRRQKSVSNAAGWGAGVAAADRADLGVGQRLNGVETKGAIAR